jgi:hypothetical protein
MTYEKNGLSLTTSADGQPGGRMAEHDFDDLGLIGLECACPGLQALYWPDVAPAWDEQVDAS